LSLPPLPMREGKEVQTRTLLEDLSETPTPPASGGVASPSEPGRVPNAPSPLRLLAPALAVIWATGTTLLLLWLGVCAAHLARLRRAARAVTSGPAPEILARLTPRPPALLAHASVRSPFLAGLRRPAIFLPADHDALFDPAALRAILAHELAHLARRGNAWTLAARLLCALLWPQPLLWLLCRRLEQIGEEACDEAVLAQDCPPRTYADCLVSLAERHPLGRRERALGAGVAPFRSSLGCRVQRILAQGTHAMSTVPPRLRLTIAALTLAAVIGGAFIVSPSPAQVDQPVKTHADKPTLVGIWTGRPTPQAKYDDELIFGPQGDVAVVEERGSVLEYGRYVVNGSALTLTLTTPGKGRTYSHAVPFSLTDTYGIVNDILTLYRSNAPLTARRVSAYPEGVAIEAVAAQQATLLGAAQAAPSPALPVSQAQLDQARFLAGLTPVEGPGVVVTLNDSKKPQPKGLPPGMTPPSLIHDTDINQVISELRAAGAEAIAVNGQRLVATSAIRAAGPAILINNTPQAPPYTVQAIGDPQVLEAALNLRGGMASQLKSFDPAMFSVRYDVLLTLPAYAGANGPRYARPLDNKAASQNTVRFLAGLTPVEGPGVVVTLSDSRKPFPRTLLRGVPPPNLIHDTDINQTVNELRAAGAEAIAVNGQRLVATSAVRDAGPTIFVNNVPQAPPYTVQAIGDSKTLASALTMRGGIADQIRSFDKGMFSLRQAGTLALPAYTGADGPHYAKPASSSGPAPADGAAGKTRAAASNSEAGQTRQVVGYGLRFALGKQRLCIAVADSEAARRGIPTDAFSEVIWMNGRAAADTDAAALAALHSAPRLRLTLRTNDGQVRPFTLTTKASYSVAAEAAVLDDHARDLKARQAELAAAKAALAGSKQQLRKEIRDALPQADPKTLAAAFITERRLGFQVGSLTSARAYKDRCRKKKNPVSYAAAVGWERRAEGWVKQSRAEEAKLFPQTGQAQSRLPQIHVSARLLSNRQESESEREAIADAVARFIRLKPLFDV